MNRHIPLIVAFLASVAPATAGDRIACTLMEAAGQGGYGGKVDVEISSRAASPNRIPDGWVPVGAGTCTFTKGVEQDPDDWRMEGALAAGDGLGSHCVVKANSHVHYPLVKLQLWVCGIAAGAPGNTTRRAPFSNEGLGGNTVVLAINGSDPKKALPVDYRLCNTAGGADIAVVDNGAAKPLIVPMGTCVETMKPAGVAFRTPYTVVVNETGFYRAFAGRTFRGARKVRLRMAPDEKLDQTLRGRVIVADATLATAACAFPPWQGGPRVDPSWAGYCQLAELKAGKHYRLCFETGFSMQGEGRLEYPGGLLPLVLDAARMADKQSDNYIGFGYQAITYGCRDVFDLKDAFVLIANNNWNSQKVQKIRYSFSEITIVH